MPSQSLHRLLLLIATLLMNPGLALAAGEPPSAERQSLAQHRHDIDAQLERALRACTQRFDVTVCSQQARFEHAAALKPVQQREEALQTAERRERAAAQREAVAQRQREFASEDARRKTKSLLTEPRASSSAAAGASAAAKHDPQHVQARANQERRADQAEREARLNVAAAEERRRAAAAHLQVVHEREARLKAKEEAKGTVQLPLPVPSSVRP